MSPQLSSREAVLETSACIAIAAWHSLFWLVFANGIGVLIAVLLLFPALNPFLGEWTYGRWVMAHMNLELYGWASLPMTGFLFRVYGADRGRAAIWCRPVLWVWSAALAVGTLSWLGGNTSGKLFLDWSGYARVCFPLAMFALWLLLAMAFAGQWKHSSKASVVRAAKALGLVLLLAVPFGIYITSSPNVYPPINPDTGGPTGASQLESGLAIVAILLMLPFGISRRRSGSSRRIALCCSVFAVECFLCISLGRGDMSHHLAAQYLSLASLLLWIPLTPAYYAAFHWHPETRRWRIALLCWWSALLFSGWVLFLPGILDHFKFTDGLVAHSLLAMAGFLSSMLIVVMIQLLGDDGRIFTSARAFYLWNIAVGGYVVSMMMAGWREGFDPAFSIAPGPTRNVLYIVRLVAGVLMFAASLEWLRDATGLPRRATAAPMPLVLVQEKTA